MRESENEKVHFQRSSVFASQITRGASFEKRGLDPFSRFSSSLFPLEIELLFKDDKRKKSIVERKCNNISTVPHCSDRFHIRLGTFFPFAMPLSSLPIAMNQQQIPLFCPIRTQGRNDLFGQRAKQVSLENKCREIPARQKWRTYSYIKKEDHRTRLEQEF